MSEVLDTFTDLAVVTAQNLTDATDEDFLASGGRAAIANHWKALAKRLDEAAEKFAASAEVMEEYMDLLDATAPICSFFLAEDVKAKDA